MRRLTRNEWIATAVAIVVVAYFLLGGLVASFFKPSMSMNTTQSTMNDINDQNQQNTNPEIATTSNATSSAAQGPVASEGSTVTVNYTLKLANGQVIDTSIGRGPFSFTIGQHQVISGWEKGLVGVRAGDHKDLVISPEDGYGTLAPGETKTNPLQGETLYFSIDVLKVEN
jgi:FKBP-type peptidyl-prolyl cis-trans isomerase